MPALSPCPLCQAPSQPHNTTGSGGLGEGKSAARSESRRVGLAPLPGMALGELAREVQESLPWRCEGGRAGGLTTSATTQAQIQGWELARFNIYSIYELLELVKGSVQQIQAAGSP